MVLRALVLVFKVLIYRRIKNIAEQSKQKAPIYLYNLMGINKNTASIFY